MISFFLSDITYSVTECVVYTGSTIDSVTNSH